jgi:hypothetical protein
MFTVWTVYASISAAPPTPLNPLPFISNGPQTQIRPDYSTMEAATYSMLFLCSEKTRRMNSPSSLGSNVEGMMQYTPGGNLKRQLTSRRLIKDGDRATDALYLK